MKRGLAVVALVVAGGLGTFSLSGAHDGHSKHLPDTKDVIALRAYLMENVGANAKEMNDKVKAGKIESAKVNAQAITLHSLRIPELFPPGSLSETSKAKEEIWQRSVNQNSKELSAGYKRGSKRITSDLRSKLCRLYPESSI
ncbi:MAG: cytochrome c [Deltaproteobacteria bacterium]|nr:cytochrome c [Deltaproteobacteria bacterium]